MMSTRFIFSLVFSTLVFSPHKGNAQDARNDTSAIYLQIEFGEIFNKDKVDVSINDSLILKKAVLINNNSYGLTSVWAVILKKEDKYLLATSASEAMLPIGFKLDKLEIKLRFQGKQLIYNIDKTKGKYLLFGTDKHGKMMYNQTVKMPQLD